MAMTPGISRALDWPQEPADAGADDGVRFDAAASNLLLDFHGSLQDPDLVLFMAGNQFRALPELVTAFRSAPEARNSTTERIFYVTAPPGRLLDAMDAGRVTTGNFVMEIDPRRLWPDVFMASPRELQRLAASGRIGRWSAYARIRGVALLVCNGNPLEIRGVADLVRADVRVAISAEAREPSSFSNYATAIRGLGSSALLDAILAKPSTRHPWSVHHREIPQMLANGEADVAPLYHHLAEYLVTHMPATFAMVSLPDAGNVRDELAAAILNDAPRIAAAEGWCNFLRGTVAADILARHGFDRP